MLLKRRTKKTFAVEPSHLICMIILKIFYCCLF